MRSKSWLVVIAVLLLLLGPVIWLLWSGADAPPIGPVVAAPGHGNEPTAAAGEGSAVVPTPTPTERELLAIPPASAVAEQRFAGVVKEEAEPIAGATVELFAGLVGDGPRLAATATDADGRFEFVAPSGIAPPFSARASADGYHAAKACLLTAGHLADLQLRRMLELTGVVRSRRDGAPLAGASVSDDFLTVATDERGRYALQATRNYGRVNLTVSASGHASQTVGIAVGEARHLESDFDLSPSAPMTVRIVERETGAPIAHVDVQNGFAELLGRTDTEGRFVIDVGAGQDVTLRVQVPGRCSFEWSWTATDGPLPLPRLPLARCGRVEGRITDGLGHGVADAAFEPAVRHKWSAAELQADGLPGRVVEDASSDETVTTDGEGRFALPVCAMPAPQVVRATRAGFVAVESAPFTVTTPGAVVRCDLVMPPSAKIVGSVRRNGVPWSCWVHWRQGELVGRAFTGNGDYQLDDVPAGMVELAIATGGSGRRCVTTLQVAPGAQLHHDFTWDEPVGVIRGRVTTPTAAPLVDAPVSANTEPPDAAGRAFDARTDADGWYVLEVAADRVYRVAVHHGPVERERRGIAPGTNGVDFELPDLATLRVRLVDAATQQPVQVSPGGASGIAWREQGEGPFRRSLATIGTTGLARLTVPVGLVDLSIALQPCGYGVRQLLGVSVAATDDELCIELTRGVDLRLSLRGPHAFADEQGRRRVALFVLDVGRANALGNARRPAGGTLLVDADELVDGVILKVLDPGVLHQLVRFDAADHATISGLLPGRYQLASFPDDYVFEPATFAVGPGDTDVELRWRRR